MNFNQISAWSIRNPIIPIVFFVALTFAGLLSFNRMEVQNDPDVDFPVVIVGINQPGAAPTEIDTQITEKVESAVSTVEGVDVITSSVSEGYSQTVVQFQIGTDINVAVNEVKASVDQVRGDLPDGILEPRVFRVQNSDNSFASYAVESQDMTMEQLSFFVDDVISKRLLAVPGMASAGRRGGVDREIRVVLDPQRMQSFGVTASQINGVLRQNNTDAGGGQAEIAGSRQSVRVLGNADTAFELGERRISLGGGRTIKLSDVADVSDGNSEIRSISKVDGKPVVTFRLTRAKGESDVSVYDAAQIVIAQIEEENPGIDIVELDNQVQYTKGQYSSSMAAMIEGAVLAVVVVFFFLRDWRATIIAAIAIPLSAIPTFFFMDQLGFTLNSLSLLALGLVAGVLVDDAIVEIENIVRHMRMGKTAYQASIDAADEIGLAVVSTTFCIVAVFLPVGLMPGIAGEFFKNFGLTVVVAVLMSLAVARMITPMAAAYFMKSHGHADHANGPWVNRYESVLRWTLDRSEANRLREGVETVHARWWGYPIGIVLFTLIGLSFAGATGAVFYFVDQALAPHVGLGLLRKFIVLIFSAVVGWYAARLVALFVRYVLVGFIPGMLLGERFRAWYDYRARRFWARFHDNRVKVMGVGLWAFVATIISMASLPVQFLPNVNLDYSQISIRMAPGTTLEQTEEMADSIEAIVREEPEVERILVFVSEGSASLSITLRDGRERTSQEFERETARYFADIPDARVSFRNNQGPGGGGTGRDITVMLQGSDPDLLESTAQQVVEEMRGLSELGSPRVEADMQRPELIITPRPELAASLGVSTVSLSQAIRIATIGEVDQSAAKFSLSNRQVPIRVMLPKSGRSSIETIRNLPVPTSSGGSVPLERVAEISFGSGPTSIQRYDRQRRVFIGADLAPGAEMGVANAKIKQLPTMKSLPTGVSTQAAGSEEFLADLISDFQTALVTGIMLVFAVLVLLYQRLMSPLVNMGALLLAPLGGFIAIALIGQPISMPVFIGVLMLFGIVSKNSILLVDFAIDEMAKGTRKFEAIIDAGRKRAQPIVMTTVAMTAGMIPTAMSLNGDGAWRAPMGTVVIGGLILSTLLTLLIVPAGFSLADGIEKRYGPKLRKNLLSYRPGDEKGGASDASGEQPGQAQPAE
ncbi:efflux RND transporter permease subunit [Paraurantiacibacter namhicola]|uniref:Multidrug resistance protein MdtB n=1 Tax=Paraurantiacibacter namhicola TaxID=645517 RepID=A0A1C7D5D2_9SPHN|nr:efflux RND transporter permease subunit [Paraurantiacibacter namhicola]ANU06686.1 Multidrug resistance protein MdtB [Paraurantiacibacter namhicola]